MTDLDRVTENFRKVMTNSPEKTGPSLTRKGRTLYIINEEARELRRIDRIFEGRK
jgi:hypothetical protein